MRKVFETLSKYGLFLNVKKTTFAKSKLEFLGHVIGVEGIIGLDKLLEIALGLRDLLSFQSGNSSDEEELLIKISLLEQGFR